MTFMYFFFVVTWYVLNVMMAKLWCLPKPQALMRWCSQMWSNTEMRELDAIHIRVSDVSALVLCDCRCTFTLNLMCNLSAEEWRQAYARDQSRQSSGIHSLGFGFLSIPMCTHAMVNTATCCDATSTRSRVCWRRIWYFLILTRTFEHLRLLATKISFVAMGRFLYALWMRCDQF